MSSSANPRQSVNPNKAEIDVVLIDNFDSFSYNLVNQITPMVNNVSVFRNDIAITTVQKVIENSSNLTFILLSPGPGNPDEAGITLELIKRFSGKYPILGICLGHQAIVQAFGGTIGLASSVMHGKTSDIQFDECETTLFKNLNCPFRVARYHSLTAASIPSELRVIAKIENEVMAVKHQSKKILGFQFHPESILTTQGTQLMKNSFKWLKEGIESRQGALLE